MAAATIVDSTDGSLARKVRIKEVVPSFDGRRLDDIVDFLTYTFLPLLLIWRAGILPPGQEAWLFLPLLASAYGFCQVQAKTDDGYFLGFPSLWNVVALYLYMLPFGPWLGLAGRRGRAGDPDFRADPPPLSLAARPVQSDRDAPRRSVDIPVRLAHLEAAARRQKSRVELDHAATGPGSLFATRLFYLGVSWAISMRYWRKQDRRSNELDAHSSVEDLVGFIGPRPVRGLRRHRRRTEALPRRRRTR